MQIHMDPDEWEAVSEFHDYGNGMGTASWGMRRRPPQDVARIKAERLAEHEARILAEADAIRARRVATGV